MTSNIGAQEIARNTPLGFAVSEDETGITYEDMKGRIMGELQAQYEAAKEQKDLVLSMMSYHFYDRPSIEQIRSHPWLRGELPSQEEIVREMSKLKKEFIIKEI
jgi:ATP-dependent Clp protease ATP-binding subunit ClpC